MTQPTGTRQHQTGVVLPARRAGAEGAGAAPGGGTRTEKDTMGAMEVPGDVLYGASTQRAVLNFPVSGRPVPGEVIRAYALLKAACAAVNRDLGRLPGPKAAAITRVCAQIAGELPGQGGLAKHFPIDIFQTGSGTSTNMNVNEVIANLVCVMHGQTIGRAKDPEWTGPGAGQDAPGVHPNDHVNMGQSSNDTFPSAMHIAASTAIAWDLLPAVRLVAARLESQAAAWDRIVKIGRTHLQDATPIRLGQEFSGYAAQMRHAERRLEGALDELAELPIGGTAVGTGINAHEEFGGRVCAELTRMLASEAWTTAWAGAGAGGGADRRRLVFRESANHFEAQHAKDGFVEASARVRTLAVSLSKIASDIRLMGMGPRCGLGELILPAVQPGSSIMPGKVNPVICESMIMVCCQVIGNDHAVALGGLGGVGSLLDLNVAMPMMAANLLDSARLLAAACRMFDASLLAGLKPDLARCAELIEGSLAMCTSLVPVIGYDRAAALAKEALKRGVTVRELAYTELADAGAQDLAGNRLTRADIDRYLDPWSMTLPGGEGSAGG
ncbi:MAG TPA: class II fumarate hydratase [Phycisphaerales bacterium]|nr:class II fumarate hydratase [Phycisphaerales bacterium]